MYSTGSFHRRNVGSRRFQSTKGANTKVLFEMWISMPDERTVMPRKDKREVSRAVRSGSWAYSFSFGLLVSPFPEVTGSHVNYEASQCGFHL